MEESFMGLLKEAAPDRLCCHRRWFAKLRSLYESPSRHYHRLSHVESMLSGIGSVFLVDEYVDPKSELERFQDVTATRLAVWFHDAIYDATAGDNEEQSAVLFQEYAQEMAMDEAQARQVAEMIIATKRHRTAAHESDTTAPTGTDDVHRMLDLDMMILGSEWDVYEAYSQAIRREYAHLTTDAFCAGRARALRSFLSIPHIFCTRTGHELWEERARANIAKEIGILERSSASE